MTHIGESTIRVDALDKVRGVTQFASDINRPGQAYMKILFSGRAHAVVKRVDTRAAEQVAGVLAVLAQGNSGAVQQYLNQRNSGQPGGDTSGFNSAFVDTAGGQLYRLVVSVPLEAGKILRLTQDVALGGGASRTAPWRVLRTERQIAAAG